MNEDAVTASSWHLNVFKNIVSSINVLKSILKAKTICFFSPSIKTKGVTKVCRVQQLCEDNFVHSYSYLGSQTILFSNKAAYLNFE